MNHHHRSLWSAAALCVASLTMHSAAHATVLLEAFAPQPFADTALPGTDVAARPELAGTVLADVLTPFSFNGVVGTVQSRVVREAGATLDFYWQVHVTSVEDGPGIESFRLSNFGYDNIIDGDWRSDGLGSVAPGVARLFNETDHPEGAVNFIFDAPVKAGESSRLFFLRTAATSYASAAQYDLCSVACSSANATFAPSAVPEPASYALAVTGLAVVGAGLRKRRR